jgi:hypothetical protein
MTRVAARALARLIALILSATLAVAGLAVAVFSAQGDTSALSLPHLAGLLRLNDLLGNVGLLLRHVEAGGPVAKVATLIGAGAVALGLLLLFGALVSRRERLVVMRRDEAGTIAAHPRAIGQAAVTLGEQSRDVLHATAKARPKRHGAGGRLRLTAYHAQSSDGSGATTASRDRVRALAESFSLGVRVRSRVPRRGARVS